MFHDHLESIEIGYLYIYIYISPKLYELNPAAHEIVNPGMIYIRAPAGFCVLFLHGKIQRCHTKETPAVE